MAADNESPIFVEFVMRVVCAVLLMALLVPSVRAQDVQWSLAKEKQLPKIEKRVADLQKAIAELSKPVVKAAPVVAAPQTFRQPVSIPYHAGHNCPDCGYQSPPDEGTWLIRGYLPDGDHLHSCPKCGKKWKHH